MTSRSTRISTTNGGTIQENYNESSRQFYTDLVPGQKIKVFISSRCGIEKYDKVRADLKDCIENTRLATVYTFEGEGAATYSAGSHYRYALEDSDVCIFLVDNADGIGAGVQEEIDIVKKLNIKALYYFCDERSKDKTPLEQSLMGAKFAKSKTVHKFEELCQDSAQALVDDIISIYHYYCKGRINFQLSNEKGEYQSADIDSTENADPPIMPKVILKNIGQCKAYIFEFLTGNSYKKWYDAEIKSCAMDEWGAKFLPILLENKSIKEFNTSMYMNALKDEQSNEHYQVVQIRWQAIQAYFSGDVTKCQEYLEQALSQAKETNQPEWVTDDILIDLRNLHWVQNAMNNVCYEPQAQKDLNSRNDVLYYPVLDRILESLNSQYIDDLYKKKTESPHTITIGSNIDQYAELLASSYIVAMYHGSLSHILLIYNRLKDCLFCLSSRYNDWHSKLGLLKLAIFTGTQKEVKRLEDSYPDVLSKMTAGDAASIMEFCNNQPIAYKRLISQLHAFGTVGYYLDDKLFKQYEVVLLDAIKRWLNGEDSVFEIGNSIFPCLSGVSFRLSQDALADICCLWMDRGYSRWYRDLFRFIGRNIKLQRMSKSSAESLIEHVVNMLANKDGLDEIKCTPDFLYMLRIQNKGITQRLDKEIAEKMPTFYHNEYSLETSKTDETVLKEHIHKHIQYIQQDNENQGKNGMYYGRVTHSIATVKALLDINKTIYDSTIIDSIITVVSDTLLYSKQDMSEKLDAISLLIYIVLNFESSYMRNIDKFNILVEKQEQIETEKHDSFFSNINSISLQIALQFLYAAMGIDTSANILELIPYIQDDIATTISVAHIICDYLESNKSVTLPGLLNSVVLQYVLQWLRMDNLEIRHCATRILLAMLRKPENRGIVNHELIFLVDSDNLYIKNLILRNIYKINEIEAATRDYFVSKCEKDANYVVRMVCAEEKSDQCT